ncbi:ferrichrome transport system permease protein FhuG [Roseibium sp. TrichSKD4]|uniref:FecCD family ABC transporter permease n=1 Tax=Roseibium sp. TrichSKD4 TaxID=744980 RepID=UPI0001E56C40|nr:iron ABC transporter permease [Roseibium sp. TrichSKD4]EFO32693.1 ferrichrome transport system permease protein FhuG [Roseibium sp. TrichSKD4]
MSISELPAPIRVSREGQVFAVFSLLLCVGAALSLAYGGTEISLAKLWSAATWEGGRFETIVLWKLRIPRTFVALLAGGALGLAGLIMQTVLRNPLASPELTGVTMGGALAVVATIVFLPWVGIIYHAWVALLGGLVAGGLVISISLNKQAGSLGLILAGVAISSLCAAGIMIILTGIAPASQPAYLWLIGSMAGRGALHLQTMLPCIVLGLAITVIAHRPLALLRLGDEAAQAAGVNIPLWRTALLFAALSLTAGVVAVAGPVAFVGLIAPHLARFALKSHQGLLIAAPLLGSVLMVFADLLAKTVATPREVPLGLFLSLIGAPILIHLIRSSSAFSSPTSGAIE